MADESGDDKPAILERFADFKITGSFAINLRILLEPISILRIILIFIALFAFSLTAGFNNPDGIGNVVTCKNASNSTYQFSVGFSYPYRTSSFNFFYNNTYNLSYPSQTCNITVDVNAFSSSSEFYVFMTVMAFLFGIMSIVVYVIFYVPRYDISKFLSVIDFVATLVLAFFLLMADIAWSAGSNNLSSYISDVLSSRRRECLPCVDPDAGPLPTVQNFVQVTVSLLFGWSALLFLLGSVWFAYKDTIFHLERMGPLYKLPFCKQSDSERYTDTEREDFPEPTATGATPGGPTGGGGGGWDDEDKW